MPPYLPGERHEHYGKRREETTQFKGGRQLRRGYVFILVEEDHPYFCMARNGGGNGSRGSFYIPEHRLVMAEWIHRPLRSSEVVHHKNGVRHDNRIENLALFHSKSAHMAHHHKEWKNGAV